MTDLVGQTAGFLHERAPQPQAKQGGHSSPLSPKQFPGMPGGLGGGGGAAGGAGEVTGGGIMPLIEANPELLAAAAV